MALRGRALEPGCLGWSPALLCIDHATLSDLLNLSEPHVHHLVDEDKRTYLIELSPERLEPFMARVLMCISYY